MQDVHVYFRKFASMAVGLVIAAALVIGVTGCGSDQPESATVNGDETNAESFTFFELGPHSLYSDATRRALKEKLGNDAVSYRNMIILEEAYAGFLEKHFNDLHQLDRRLNSDFGDRVDHDTTKLTYRYARKRNVPFDYVEILFANDGQKPLTIKIRFKEDTLGTIDQLKKKYGPPGEIIWEGETGRTLFWQKQKDLLLASLAPNQFGAVEHQIVIYFIANIEDLLQTEQARKLKASEEKRKTGQSAF